MFTFNSKTYVNRTFKKSELSKIIKVTTEIKHEIKTVESVVLEQVLSSVTIGMKSTEQCQEIYVFGIYLKEEEVPIHLIQELDRVTALHTYFKLYYRKDVKEVCIYRTLEGDKIKRHKIYETEWLDSQEQILPYCNNLEEVYEALVKSLIHLPLREDERLEGLLHRYEQVQKLAKQINKLEQKINREKQPKKKFELARQLRVLQGDFKQLQEV